VPQPHDHPHVQPADDHQGQQVGADEKGDLVGLRTQEVVRGERAHAIGDVLLGIGVHLRKSMIERIEMMETGVGIEYCAYVMLPVTVAWQPSNARRPTARHRK